MLFCKNYVNNIDGNNYDLNPFFKPDGSLHTNFNYRLMEILPIFFPNNLKMVLLKEISWVTGRAGAPWKNFPLTPATRGL